MYLVTWRCPTLTWGCPTLPSALQRFTSEFGMVQVVPPHYRRQDNSLITCLFSFISRYSVLNLPFTRSYWPQAELNFLSIESSYLICLSSLLFRAFPKTLERCIVKPLGQLVQVSSMTHITYTPCLSTS